jgi:hypothetical protein
MILLNPILENEAENVIKNLTQQFLDVSMTYQIGSEETKLKHSGHL